MFTGLVQDLGKVVKVQKNAEGKLLTISSSALSPEIKIDDSVSINGACQTAVSVSDDSFTVQAVHVTLQKTTLEHLKTGDEVNLELALRPMDRLGGHFVQGHVNGQGRIESIENLGKNYLVWIALGDDLMKYTVSEGSIALNGVSLTISERKERQIQVSIIPHTWDHTTFKHLKVGSSINVEVDVLAKYVHAMLSPQKPESKVTMEWLRDKGML